MIYLIGGTTHTGKTNLAQKLLEQHKIPYLSIDHLKMGFIRSKQTNLTLLSDDEKLTDYLWPMVREIIKTVIENNQNMIIEGCYIPFDWKKDFDKEYLKHIHYTCLIMSETYIRNHFFDIKKYANVIENRIDDNISMEELIVDNKKNLELVKKYELDYILINDEYKIENIE